VGRARWRAGVALRREAAGRPALRRATAPTRDLAAKARMSMDKLFLHSFHRCRCVSVKCVERVLSVLEVSRVAIARMVTDRTPLDSGPYQIEVITRFAD